MLKNMLSGSGITPGSLVLLEVRKKGVLRGRGMQKVTYGNDRVQVILMVGPDLENVRARSNERLLQLESSGHLISDLVHAVRRGGGEASVAEAILAIQRTQDRLRLRPPGDLDGQEDVVPLYVDGNRIPASRVLADGSILLVGIKLQQKVLHAAEYHMPEILNGESGCRQVLRKMLPDGLWVSYVLTTSPRDWTIRLAKASELESPEMRLLAEQLNQSVQPFDWSKAAIPIQTVSVC